MGKRTEEKEGLEQVTSLLVSAPPAPPSQPHHKWGEARVEDEKYHEHRDGECKNHRPPDGRDEESLMYRCMDPRTPKTVFRVLALCCPVTTARNSSRLGTARRGARRNSPLKNHVPLTVAKLVLNLEITLFRKGQRNMQTKSRLAQSPC